MPEETPKKKSLLRKLISLFVILLLIVIGIVAFVLINLNSTIRVGGEHIVTGITGGQTTIGNVDISLFKGDLLISDIVIKNPTQNAKGEKTDFSTEEFFKLGKLKIKLDVASLLSDTIHVEHVIVDAPFISYEKTPFSDSNHHVLMGNIEANTGGKDKKKEADEDQGKDKEKPSKKVVIDLLEVSNSTLNLSSCGITAPIALPTLTLNDLGKEEKGVDVGTAIAETFSALFSNIFNVVKDVTTNVGTWTKDSTKTVVKGTSESLKKAGEAVKDAGKSLKSSMKNLFK